MFLNLKTNQYPVTESEIRLQNPNVSYPLPFNPGEEYALVFQTPQPELNSITQVAVEVSPKLSTKGNWEQQWEVRSKFQEYTDENGVVHTVKDQEDKAILEDTNQKVKVLTEGIISSVQKRLDDFARTRNYDGILSACTYATSMIEKFKNEGQYCVTARDSTWAALYQILEEVNTGVRPIPSGYQDIESDLPELIWPI